MRIKASVPSVLPGSATGWCAPCVPYAGPQVGFLMLPEVGSALGRTIREFRKESTDVQDSLSVDPSKAAAARPVGPAVDKPADSAEDTPGS